MSVKANNKNTLTTESGKTVPELCWHANLFLDRTTAIYGPSQTGKSFLVKTIMKTLQPLVDQIIVVSSTEPSNRSYEGYVDQPLIHYRLWLADPKNPRKDDGPKGAVRFLEAIWKRQEMMAAIYTRANRLQVLASLFSRLPRHERSKTMKAVSTINGKRVKVLNQVRRQYRDEPGRCEEKVKDVNEGFKKMLVLLYKKAITPHFTALWERSDLSEDELYTLQYLHFNPRLLLILDDCAAQFKTLFNKEIFRSYFYQNRHSFITLVGCFQDDTDLATNLRKNAFVSLFTEGVVCNSNFTRPTNKFPKSVQQFAAEAAAEIFKEKHRKFAFIREDPNRQYIYHVTGFYSKPFRFGSTALHELCDRVRTEGVAMDKENPYYSKFKVDN
jgi:hypothetical protein